MKDDNSPFRRILQLQGLAKVFVVDLCARVQILRRSNVPAFVLVRITAIDDVQILDVR